MFMEKYISRRVFIKGLAGLAAMEGSVSIGWGYYVNLPKFGAGPSGRRSERVLNSPNWDGSKFENYEPILNIVKHSEDDEEDNGYSYKLLLPEIGELVAIPSDKEYPQWWIDI